MLFFGPAPSHSTLMRENLETFLLGQVANGLQGHKHHVTVLLWWPILQAHTNQRLCHMPDFTSWGVGTDIRTKPTAAASSNPGDLQMQMERICEKGMCHISHPGSPRATCIDFPFEYYKAILEEDVYRVELLCSSLLIHTHTLETLWRRVFPLMKHFWSTSNKGVTIFGQSKPGVVFRSKFP